MITKIEFTCTNGHSQVIEYNNMQREFAESVAKLTDGSSPLYVHKPGPDSPIGKCQICKAQLTSRVIDEPSVDTVNHPQQVTPIQGT